MQVAVKSTEKLAFHGELPLKTHYADCMHTYRAANPTNAVFIMCSLEGKSVIPEPSLFTEVLSQATPSKIYLSF